MPGRPAKNLDRMVFGRLTVLNSHLRKGTRRASLCLCKCGKETIKTNSDLQGGNVESCGCLLRESRQRNMRNNRRNQPFVDGRDGTETEGENLAYNSWKGMMSRCYDKRYINYPIYGGVGIKVCERWRDPERGFLNFLEDMGERPSKKHSLDRINGLNYAPENCRWAIQAEQIQNRRVRKDCSSGLHGVIHNHGKTWMARIGYNIKQIHLGVYDTKEEAAYAYNVGADFFYGPNSRKNPVNIPKQKREEIKSRVQQLILRRKDVGQLSG